MHARAWPTERAFASSPTPSWFSDLDGRYVQVNDALCRMLGRTVDELMELSVYEVIHPEQRAAVMRIIADLRDDLRADAAAERHYVRPDGRSVFATVVTSLVRDADGRPHLLFSQAQDITTQRLAQAQLRQRLVQQSVVAELGVAALGGRDPDQLVELAVRAVSDALDTELTSLFELSADAVLRLRAHTGWPRGVSEAFGMPVDPSTPAGLAVTTGLPVVYEDADTDPRLDAAALHPIGARSGVVVLIGEPRSPFGTLGAHSRAPRGFAHEDVHFMQSVANVLADAIERRHSEKRMEHQALHDALTGLPNRLLFEDRLEQSLRSAVRTGTMVTVLFVDLDEFKLINDSFGHHAGDELLRAVAHRLATVVRDTDTLARLGGDEFAIVTSAPPEELQAESLAVRLHEQFARPFRIAGEEFYVTASIGVAVAAEDRDGAQALLRDADAAMYQAKRRGRGRFQLADRLTQSLATTRLRTERELREALDGGQLRLVFQPMWSLDGAPRLIGAEALLRWEHPERGLLAPLEFIDVAEESGLIVPIGTWVLGEACRQAAEWPVNGSEPPILTVNLSPRQLAGGELRRAVEGALEASGLPGERVGVEVTESGLLHADEAVEPTLAGLRELGVRVLLDDFGTGYSSLSHLRRFPIDALKIDRSFIEHIDEDEGDDVQLVRAIVQMARSMGMRVIPEGIETAVQLERVRGFGCRLGQGFYLSPPVDASALPALFG